MHNAANVYLWGTHVGTVSLQDGNPIAAFQYTDAFRGMGVEISPVRMPLSPAVFSFPDLPIQSFHGLPGLLSDSLPDKFGNKVIAAWLREQNKSPEDLNVIDRLCYAGRRGMGALEYRPALLDEDDVSERVTVEALSELADRVLRMREDAKAALIPGMNEYSSILKVGSSAGGARAKAIIGWNEETGEVRSGQVKLPDGFGYWLIKFDGLVGNGDKEGDDKWGYGRVEYAYHLMARAAGIKMSECRLWNKRHFMTRRFDRLENGGKLHMQTLGAMAHLDFNDPVSHSYEQAFRVTRRVVNDARANEQLFRRMAFNTLRTSPISWTARENGPSRPPTTSAMRTTLRATGLPATRWPLMASASRSPTTTSSPAPGSPTCASARRARFWMRCARPCANGRASPSRRRSATTSPPK